MVTWYANFVARVVLRIWWMSPGDSAFKVLSNHACWINVRIYAGAHTIGSGICILMSDRLYNFSGTNAPDPSLRADYLDFLRTKCRRNDNVTRQAMNFTPNQFAPPLNETFDNKYHKQLLQHGGYFTSDATLITNTTGLGVVNSEASNNFKFLVDFGKAMIAMGNIEVKTGTNGAIHRICSSATGSWSFFHQTQKFLLRFETEIHGLIGLEPSN